MLYKKILFLIILMCISAFSQLKISEVMRNPVGSESASPGGKTHEYIEVVNLGDATINLVGMKIFDGTISDEIIETDYGKGIKELKAGQIGLILDRDIFPLLDKYPLNIPDSVAVFTVNHASICGGLTTNDNFVILDGQDTVAQFETEIENEADGYSVIPVSLLKKEISYKTQTANAGIINNYNFGVLREYEISRKQNVFECRVFYRNFAGNAFLENRKLDRGGEIVLQKELSSTIVFSWQINGKDVSDTVSAANLFVNENSVVITEVASRAAIEWLELYWTGECFPLENWHLLVGESVVNLPKIDCPQDKILCISEDDGDDLIKMLQVPNWRKVNNYADTIFLVAPFGVVDSIAWTSTLFAGLTDENTIQRKNSKKSGFEEDNIFAGTPTPEAILMSSEIKKFSIELSSKKFTPNGDQNLDSLIITAQKPRNGSVKIEIYGMDGKLLRTFEDAANTRFVWDGRTEHGKIAEIGPVFIIATFDDKKSKFSDRKNAVLWR